MFEAARFSEPCISQNLRRAAASMMATQRTSGGVGRPRADSAPHAPAPGPGLAANAPEEERTSGCTATTCLVRKDLVSWQSVGLRQEKLQWHPARVRAGPSLRCHCSCKASRRACRAPALGLPSDERVCPIQAPRRRRPRPVVLPARWLLPTWATAVPCCRAPGAPLICQRSTACGASPPPCWQKLSASSRSEGGWMTAAFAACWQSAGAGGGQVQAPRRLPLRCAVGK